MSKIMYKDKQILGCISDSKYASYDNTGTGLSATNAQDAITELNGKLIESLHTGSATVSVSSGKAILTHNLAIEGRYTIEVICTSNQNFVFPYTPTANSVALSFCDGDFRTISGVRTINYTIKEHKQPYTNIINGTSSGEVYTATSDCHVSGTFTSPSTEISYLEVDGTRLYTTSGANETLNVDFDLSSGSKIYIRSGATYNLVITAKN